MLGLFIGACFILLLVASIGYFLILKLPSHYWVPINTLLLTILFTPSLAPATIVVVPMPFGIMLGVGIFGGAPQEIIQLVAKFWQWHLPAFSITAVIAFFISKALFKSRLKIDYQNT